MVKTGVEMMQSIPREVSEVTAQTKWDFYSIYVDVVSQRNWCCGMSFSISEQLRIATGLYV